MAAFGILTLRNYRCFNWNNPATLAFGDGFTALVGPNNSGKSSALRSVYELRSLFGNLLQTILHSASYQLQVAPIGVSDVAELANDDDPRKFQFDIEIPLTLREVISVNYFVTKVIFEYEILTQSCIAKSVCATNIGGNEITLNEQEIKTGSQPQNGCEINYKNRDIYVDYSPLIAFGLELSSSRYFPAFRNAINEGSGSYYDIPVGTALVQNWNQWKAGSLRFQKIAISRVEEEIARLLGFNTLQINADQTVKTLDVNIDGRPQKLHEVGAGVAQLIIVLAAALIQKPSYILIDEPELSLHPSLQLNFLSTLGSYAQKGLLYSTHSIGLARSSAQRIFTTHKIKNGSSRMEPLGERLVNFSEWLGELSYSSRLDLGCESILLVEGPTDVLFFQEFLRKMNKDHKYVVMQLGGSSLINAKIAPHIAELTRLIDPSKIHIFFDSEKKCAEEELAADRASFISECKKAGVNIRVSDRRATENYFDNKGILAALGEGYQALEHFQLLKESSKPWHKSDNWRIARAMSLEDIRETDLGHFLLSL